MKQAHRQTITTKYYGPTNCRGSRIKATSEGGDSITVPYNHGVSVYAAHAEAALALITRQGWGPDRDWVQASIRVGYVFVDMTGVSK